MSPEAYADRDRRVTRALLAQIRQQFEAPVGAIIGFAEILLEEAAARRLDALTPDLERVLAAGRQLRALVESLHAPAAAGGGDLEGLRRTLRHDLRTPLNAVKGYGEMLRDDAAERGLDEIVGDLDRLLQAADGLLGQIDSIVRFSAPPEETAAIDPAAAAGEAAPAGAAAELARALVETIKPVAVEAVPCRDTDQAATLLVVDDNQLNREMLSRRLRREGHVVATAAGGAEALARLETELFDLVLLDLLMPGMNGFEVLQRLKRDARWRDLPVIMISALDDIDSIVRCIEAGAEDYLPKPFNPVLLRARIGASLERKRLRDREQEQMRREIDLAARIQRSLLPRAPPAGFPVDGLNRPIRQVSGDFFDFFERPDGAIPFALGDVSGKGFDAALLMAKTASLFRCLAKTIDDPGVLLATLNREICETASYGRFVTAVAGVYAPGSGRLRFANAGHPAPLLWRGAGYDQFPAAAPPLGILPELSFLTEEVRLDGGAFYVFSDGLLECRRDGGAELGGTELGVDGLAGLIRQVAGQPATGRLPALIAALDRAGWTARDDLTILVIGTAQTQSSAGGGSG